MKSSLTDYNRKRDFSKTLEPAPKLAKSKLKALFVIQRHDARALHYDFRIECEGVLKSWAVPKGLPLGTEKRLAVQTEDHPISYANFSGEIPKGEYGAGTVEIWDKGLYDNLSTENNHPVKISDAIKKGHIRFFLHGKKANGEYSLVRMKSGRNWLFIRHKADIGDDDLPDFSNPDKVLFPKEGFTKLDLAKYYYQVGSYMLPHVAGRPVSMYRFPNGIDGAKFFQKNISAHFPSWIKSIVIQNTRYLLCNDERTLLYLTNLVVVPHIWPSRVGRIGFPDRMIFDIDPQNDSFREVYLCALAIRDVLEDLGLESYVMSTGSRGLHVVVPIDSKLDYKKVASFSRVIAQHVEKSNPEMFTSEFSKGKRDGKVFIDTYRNSFGQTSVAPYAVRSIAGAPVAAPLEWKELSRNFKPSSLNIKSISERLSKKGDVWQDINSNPQSLKNVENA